MTDQKLIAVMGFLLLGVYITQQNTWRVKMRTPLTILVTLFLVTLAGLMLMLASTDLMGLVAAPLPQMLFGIGLLSFIWGGIGLARYS